jgi:iron complex outermembrane receptor protein
MPATSSKPFSRRISVHGSLLRTLIVTAAACAAPLAGANEATITETATAGALEEIVVTATRREENISRVPISITAFSQDALNQKGIEDFGDIARFTPGVAFDTSQTNQIAIRGISSTGGSGTTGIYIDDVPIQVRNLGYNADDALLKLFDLDRVEILRGPQGTLFGAGSEGGAVRYITTQPSLTQSTVYAKAETAYTEGGSPSYEGGVAAGGPVIDGVFGVRVSAWYRRDGGWIDRIDPTTLEVVDKNANSDDTTVLRIAGLWQPNDALRITPSILYQNSQRNDVTIYWPEYSDPGSNRYVSANPESRPEPDELYLPSLNIQADLGSSVRFISTTAYFHRDETSGYDGTLYNLGYYQTLLLGQGVPPAGVAAFPLLDGSGVHLPPGLQNYRSPASVTNQQRNLTQEFRLQSADPTARLAWTAGAFYSLDRQFSLEQVHDPMADTFFNQLLGMPIATYFGTALNANGTSYLPMGDAYFDQLVSYDRQLAGFGEANFKLTDTLTLTAGVRVSRTAYTIESLSGGPTNGGFRPGTQASSETPVTPKAGIQWQATPNDMYYFTYAKGFRSGGGNASIPYDPTYQNLAVGCTEDFLNMGIKHAPYTYKSDSVQSFEVGAKNNIDNRVRLASSVYYIKWNNIQGNVIPPICQIQWTDNLGNAVSKGFDLQADFQLTTALSIESSFGFTDARYTTNAYPSGSVITGPNPPLPIVAAGDAVAGPNAIGQGYSIPPYSATIGLQYKFRAFAHESFVRGDYEYLAGDKWADAALDPRTSSYDPTAFPLGRQAYASLRGGTNFGGWGVSLFVDNLTDAHPIVNYNHQNNAYGDNGELLASPAFRYVGVRPRTFGLTMTFRH